MGAPLDWATLGPNWPHHTHSSFVEAAGLRWHVQRLGAEHLPVLLMVHGTGASTHTWRTLAPLLQERFHLVSMDLPGHAFTSVAPPQQQSLAGMAAAVAELLHALKLPPDRGINYAIGHSAGAAVVAQLIVAHGLTLRGWVGLNSALLPLRGLPGQVFEPAARALTALPLVPQFFAWRASRAKVLQRLLASTGSRVDAEGQRLYGLLVGSPAHAAGALGMMANWNLRSLEPTLHQALPAPLLVTASNDTTVPPIESSRAAARLPGARVVELPGLGHLAHEENAAAVAKVVLLHSGVGLPTNPLNTAAD